MRIHAYIWVLVLLVTLPLAAHGASLAELQEQVRGAERAFAHTMAVRDFKAFADFVSDEAIFFGEKEIAHGKPAVEAAWKGFFEGAEAPFSWQPEIVEVLPSGTLAHSSGPVFDKRGGKIGTFNSIWRFEDGRWRVIFDKGCAACGCKP